MKEIQRISITDAVVESIRGSIESGEYQVGQKLPTEAKLCESLKVSRTSVREAIRVLSALGYVSMIPGKGAFVSQSYLGVDKNIWLEFNQSNFYDFMEVRIAIELLAVRLSVERATSKQVNELEQIHASFIEANKEQDPVRLIMLDELFHTKIASFTNNQLLISVNKQLLKCFRTYRTDSFMNNVVYQNAVEPHEHILYCFQTKNASQAVTEMHKHLNITTKDMETIHNSTENI